MAIIFNKHVTFFNIYLALKIVQFCSTFVQCQWTFREFRPLDLTIWSVHPSVNSLSENSCASIMKRRVDVFKWLTLAFYRDTFLSLMTNSRWLVIDENKEILKVEKKRLVYRCWPREGIEVESKARLRAVGFFDCSRSKIEKYNEAISYGVVELYRSLEMETIILQLCI